MTAVDEKVYDAILFRQRPSAPVQAAFVAPSSHIDSWARVPTKHTGNIRNFQRAEITQHINEVRRFFARPETPNSSPTAVVVGFDPIRSEGCISISDNGRTIDLDTITPEKPLSVKFTIRWPTGADPRNDDERRTEIDTRRSLVTQFIHAELSDLTQVAGESIRRLQLEFDDRARAGKAVLSEELSDETSESSTDELQRGNGESGSEGEGTLGGDATPNVAGNDVLSELGVEARTLLSGLTPADRQVMVSRLEFLAMLQPDVLAALPSDTLQMLSNEIQQESKPGLLIDGQHRVAGTKKLGDIPFLVCALPKAAWPELAFQFLVTNRTARRVQEGLLISIVGNSLSREQRAAMESRLRDAGIRVGLIEAVMKVTEDPLSPFFNMLAFGIKNEVGFIDAAAIRGKVIKPWYDRIGPIKELFDHFTKGKTAKDRDEYWRDEDLWFEFFVAFWSAVRERYIGSAVFTAELADPAKKTPVSRLMAATVLGVFQNRVLRNIEAFVRQKEQKEGVQIADTIKTVDGFSAFVKNTLRPVTPEFFQGWDLSGFDGSISARKDLADAIDEVIEERRTVAQLRDPKNPHRLYRSKGAQSS